MSALASPGSQCAVCLVDRDLKRCSTCKAVYYCSVACQRSDISRHRREDGCGSYRSTPTSSSALSARTDALNAAPAAATVSKKVLTGPPCLRCRSPAGPEEEHVYASIVQRSIFAAECAHGPCCSRCAERMQRQTLPFCPGCGALVACFKARGEAGTGASPSLDEAQREFDRMD
mmetsp:Transcript_2525/g.5931  ORF Transcript_2525/g.5931 Transcript_2525/m.5931 type:complete len:174 (+) Transcript_2525:95-616(+)